MKFIRSITLFLSFALISCAQIKDAKEPGQGLTRNSFGKLNIEKLEPGISMCNSNIGMGVDEQLTKILGSIIDPARNQTGKPDETLTQDRLLKHFSFVSSSSGPVVRIIERTDNSVDFWFRADAVHEAYKSELAAQEYCKSRDDKTSKYVGFSYKCGDNVSIPVKMNGQRITAKDEEVIVAYDCIPKVEEEKPKKANDKNKKSKLN